MEQTDIGAGLREAAERWSGSPVRQRICAVLAEHPDLAAASLEPEVVAATPWQWKVSFPLNAAVHALVLDGSAPNVAVYVPSAGGTHPLDAGFDAALVELASSRSGDLRRMSARPLRTQDPRATLALHGFLQECASEFDRDRPMRLLNLGCAAGFELLLGDADFCREAPRYPIPRGRFGVDVEPIDLQDADALRWLLACTDASTAAIAPLLDHARARLEQVEHAVTRSDATDALDATTDDGEDVLVVSHQFLCSVDDPAAMAQSVRDAPRVTRWLSVEVPSTASLAYEVREEYPPGTPVATLLDGDLRLLRQGSLPSVT